MRVKVCFCMTGLSWIPGTSRALFCFLEALPSAVEYGKVIAGVPRMHPT